MSVLNSPIWNGPPWNGPRAPTAFDENGRELVVESWEDGKGPASSLDEVTKAKALRYFTFMAEEEGLDPLTGALRADWLLDNYFDTAEEIKTFVTWSAALEKEQELEEAWPE